MPYVTIKILQGRTIDEKRTLAKDITKIIVKDLGLQSEDSVSVQFLDVPPENLAQGGKLMIDR